MLAAALDLVRARKERQNFSAFAALMASPANLVTGFYMPANAELYVSSSSVLTSATALITVNARSLGAKTTIANLKRHVGWIEQMKHVVKASGAPGTVRVYVRGPAGALTKIAEG